MAFELTVKINKIWGDILKKLVTMVLVALVSSKSILAMEEKQPVLKGPYFGQTPPKLEPKIFAPNIVSLNERYEGVISFSPDLTEMYFTAKNDGKTSAIYFSKIIDGVWSPIKKANFTKGKKNQEIHPFVTTDGKKIHFTAHSNDYSDTHMWFVNRTKNGWGEAKKLNLPDNGDMAFFFNESNDGYSLHLNLSNMKTYSAVREKSVFSDVKPIGLEAGFHHAFIAPSQDYLIVAGRNKTDERKDNDLYVSFNNSDGSWSKPINLGDTINTNVNEKSPVLTADGKYLFFGRDLPAEQGGLSNIHWVSTQTIENLRPKNK